MGRKTNLCFVHRLSLGVQLTLVDLPFVLFPLTLCGLLYLQCLRRRCRALINVLRDGRGLITPVTKKVARDSNLVTLAHELIPLTLSTILGILTLSICAFADL